MELRYHIPLPPVTKKNSQQILVNRATGRPFVMPSKKFRQYERDAKLFLKKLPMPIDYPVNVKCLFYLPTKRRTDLTNLLEAVDAVPVRHGKWDDSGRYRFENGDLAIRCTGCGCSLREDEFEKFVWNYCPVCGAKMDLKGESEDG